MTEEGNVAEKKWREAVEICRRILSNRATFDSEEINYKLEISARVKALFVVLNSEEGVSGGEFIPFLKKAFAYPPNNLTSFYSHNKFIEWASEHKEEAREALLMLSDAGQSFEERIDGFLTKVPNDKPKGPGTRLSIASFLLMGLDPTNYPMFRTRDYRTTERLLGWADLPNGASPGETYAHHRNFAQRLLDELRGGGLDVRDLLDAQSLIWMLANSSDLAIATWRGEVPAESAPWFRPLEDPSVLEDELQRSLDGGGHADETRNVLVAIFRRAILLHQKAGTEGFISGQGKNPRRYRISIGHLFACADTGRTLYLLVDDDPHVRENYEVEEASSAKNELVWAHGEIDPVNLRTLLEDDKVWEAYERMLNKVTSFRTAHDNHTNYGKLSVLSGELLLPDDLPRSTWWVNQGATYNQERQGGYLWAPKRSKNGQILGHHADLARLQTGDVVFNYAKGAVRAVSVVVESVVEAPRPAELPEGPWQEEGRLVEIEYHELSESIPLEEIPSEWRTNAGGPFTAQGAVKQGYIYPLPTGFVAQMKEHFGSMLPDFLLDFGNTFRPSKRVIKIAPGRGAKFWADCLEGGYMCVGWDEVGNLLEYDDFNDFAISFRERFGAKHDNNQAKITTKSNELWKLRQLKPGDVIVANKGIAEVLAVGEVLEPGYEWRPDRQEYKHTVKVAWDTSYAGRIPEQKNWAFVTVADVSPELYELIVRGRDPGGVDYIEPTFEDIYASVTSLGMKIGERVLRRYHLALKSRGFVILSGVSGTGKTWLTEAYAKAVGAEYLVVPVAPNWNTNEDLLGYLNPMDGQYRDTPFSHFLRGAALEYERAQVQSRNPKPFHLVLDEMNLARVEYYFAQFLSAMEVRARNGTARVDLGTDGIILPPNLRFVGTINVDETTHGFADKVYDRAQLIELGVSREALRKHLGEVPYRDTLMEVWVAIHEVAPFAFRVLDEIAVYVAEAEDLDVAWQEALDEQLLQKILPKLKGADLRIDSSLERLAELTAEDFPLTNAKTREMLEGFGQHGFASYF